MVFYATDWEEEVGKAIKRLGIEGQIDKHAGENEKVSSNSVISYDSTISNGHANGTDSSICDESMVQNTLPRNAFVSSSKLSKITR